MLTALEQGVKGGVWFSLIDKVWAPATLAASARTVVKKQGAAGVDHVTTDAFSGHLDANLAPLADALRTGTYRPQAIRRVWIPKPGRRDRRPLGIPTVRDRVVQTALRYVVEPIFERDFAAHSYGFRPGRGCRDALRRVEQLLHEGASHVVDVDLQHYFDSIPHEPLRHRLRQKLADGRGLALLDQFLAQGVVEELREWTPEGGTPQGAVISPLLANIYLDPLDHQMAASGFQMVRYADDIVILCSSRGEAERALAAVQQWVAAAGLTLHPEKTRIVTHEEGFDFLGYHFERGYRWPRKRSLRKLKDLVRAQTRRTNGQSLERIIQTVNGTLRGWYAYFCQSHWTALETLDRWVRMRLRSILRRRAGRRGRGRGRDHSRWPNAFFAEHGLWSLYTAHCFAGRPSRR